MTRLGVTGHQNLPATAVDYVERRIRDAIRSATRPVTGVGCLAAGADQLFAACVLGLGGQLPVIVPCAGYESTFEPPDLERYRRFLTAAAHVDRLPFDRPGEDAYLAAGTTVVDRCDVLLAVWDGRPARGLGGTADIVRYARERGTPTEVIWPEGVVRGDSGTPA